MNVRHMALTLVVLAVLLAGAGCRVETAAGPPPSPQEVARVNGVVLTQADLDREMRHTRAYYRWQLGVDLDAPENAVQLAQARQEALQRIVDQELIRQIAEGLFPPGQSAPPITISEDEVRARAQEYEAQAGSREALLEQNGFLSYEEYLEFIRGNLRVEKLAERYGQGEQVHARHILVATEEEARRVLERLRAGEDFAQLAQELSRDTASGKNGGDLGWIGRGMTVEPFEKAAFALEVGQWSEPVKTQFGFHIIQVLEKGMRPDALAFQSWFTQMRAQAEIVITAP
ncbi:MAG: peptidylprolyl isomerase [Chloroflexia bacterium]